MDWRLKVGCTWAAGILSPGGQLNYLLQRHVTHSVPVPDTSLESSVAMARRHLETVRRHFTGKQIDSLAFYEFGAGWDMAIPLAYWALGVRRQTVVDIRRLLRPSLVQNMLNRLSHLLMRGEPLPKIACVRLDETVSQLRAIYGIDYRAPADARSTSLPSASVDVITSTSTLEHIPEPDALRILAECRRLLRPDGIITAHIACDDHYAAADSSITRLNFLRYERGTWGWLNPPLHYQNRLRSSDYIRLFRDAGFDILDVTLRQATEEDRRGMGTEWAPASCFKHYEPTDLTVTHAFLVARPAAAN